MKIIINVDPKGNILDPQGKAVSRALGNLGFENVQEVRIGRHIVLDLPVDSENEAKRIASEMCEKLLCNPLVEEYAIEVKS